jgi:GNAT superfamily N-acetyltransferase
VPSRLSRAQLDYLTQIDQFHHVALVASQATDAGDEGLGVARFIELEPGLAEAALVVTDRAQGQGLGTLLMERLCRAARERGIESFQVEFLAENTAVRALLEGVSDEQLRVVLDQETGTYSGRMPVPAPHEGHHAAWIEALVEAARNLRPAQRLSELKG